MSRILALRLGLATLLCVITPSTSPAQETVYVVLKAKSVSVAADSSMRLITLASGTQITVPQSDIHHEATAKFNETVAASAARTSAPAAPTSSTAAIIQKKCSDDWPADFRMRAFCEKQQVESLDQLAKRGPMSSGDQLVIRTKCRAEWPTDYRMQNFCEVQQLEALKKLGR